MQTLPDGLVPMEENPLPPATATRARVCRPPVDALIAQRGGGMQSLPLLCLPQVGVRRRGKAAAVPGMQPVTQPDKLGGGGAMGKRNWSTANTEARVRRNGSEDADEPLTGRSWLGLIRRMERERPLERLFKQRRLDLKTPEGRKAVVEALRKRRLVTHGQ